MAGSLITAYGYELARLDWKCWLYNAPVHLVSKYGHKCKRLVDFGLGTGEDDDFLFTQNLLHKNDLFNADHTKEKEKKMTLND